MDNNIISEFEKYASFLKTQITIDTKNKFRYSKITESIAILKKNIHLLDNLKELQKLKGIGKGTIDRINEIKLNGFIEETKNYNENNPTKKTIDILTKIIGIGPVKAKKYVNEYNITSLDDLIVANNTNKIKLTKDNLIGIKYYTDLQERIPREEITDIFELIKEYCIEFDKNIYIEVCGSYRRQCETSGDIDILISHNQLSDKKYLKKIVNMLTEKNILIDNLNTNITTKYNGMCRLNENNYARRIDIRLIDKESIPFALLYFTGSKNCNTNMRTIAKKKGLKLNEYGLFDCNSNNKIEHSFNSEEDIFNYLELNYVEPINRK
jgi:DNA polymerase/3'-5' exonuclease PolX